MTKTTCWVLGAAGFIGRHLSRELESQGLQVFGLGHGPWGEAEWRNWGLSGWMEAEISLNALDNMPSALVPQCIFHCGGSSTVSYSYSSPLQDFERTTISTASVLEWVRLHANGSCRVVMVSSAAVYGDQGDIDATENATRSPISPYGFQKVAAESVCDCYSRFFSVPVSIVRLFSVYGEGLKKQLLWDALNKFKRGESQFFGTGNELRDWIEVADAARLLALAGLLPQSAYEIYNGGNEKATTRDLLTRLAHAYGYDGKIVFTNETHSGNPHRLTANNVHARRLLNWNPAVSLQCGLERYVDWFQSVG